MRNLIPILIMTIVITHLQPAVSQDSQQPVFVIVHGAWGGGWAFKKVDSLLTAQGALVYRPTLTGQGERVHLASKEIGLDTHIQDVVNTILYEDLHDIVLVGHSYGGMVVTGVADSLPDRIRKLIYVDAFLPDDGESLNSIVLSTGGEVMQVTDGFVIPRWVAEGQKPPKDVPHPARTLSDTLRLDNAMRLQIPTTYILTVDKGANPEKDGFAKQAERARKKGWPVLQLEADHNAQWSAPEAFSEMLLGIGRK